MRAHGMRRAIAARFDDEFRFFRGWVTRPRSVGSVVPTSTVTARRMAAVIDTDSGLPVLELGPGTGVITRAILGRGVAPEKLFSIEYAPDFVRHLRRNFPRVNVIEGDAFNLGAALAPWPSIGFDCAISGIPLLNFPIARRIRFVEGILERLPAGRPLVQFTYGPRSPVPPGGGNYLVERSDFVIRNFPPTQLWIYRRGPQG